MSGFKRTARRGRFFQDGVEDYRGRRSAKRNRAGGHFIQHRAETKKIAAHVEGFAARLLRRHVRHRAHGRAGAGEVDFLHRWRVHRKVA